MKGLFLIKTKYFLFLVVMFILLLFIGVPSVMSHSFVIKESPTPNSTHQNSPPEVEITFNSKIEKSLFAIKLFDERQNEVETPLAEISKDQKVIRLKLPTLENGKYQVEYYVISSNDGHPVKGSFSFYVGNSILPEEPSEVDNTTIDFSNISDNIIYLMRAIYYFGLLFVMGWVFYWRIVRNYSDDVKDNYLFWGLILQMVHLVGISTVILMQLNNFTMNGLSFASDFFDQTLFGLLWIVTLYLSLMGLVCLFKYKWFDILWIIVMIVLKSLNGHPLEFEPTVFLVITNSIHLFAASLWAAGLLFIILFWRKYRMYVFLFLPKFSKYAFVSIVVLSITGVFTSYIYLSGFELLFSNRGILLLIKVFIVVLVLLVGVVIRWKLKEKHTEDLKKWMNIDLGLMVFIIIIVSILTYLNPA